MNNQDIKTLWNSILDYDLDFPMSEYGFSTRIAKENFWTIDFTERAIIEYKKFMFLAATIDAMVSPSEIVDIVWHQHLIFTQSYNEFCQILGKKIEHIPSTHNREDFEKFVQAKNRTQKLYSEIFETQPQDIWNFSTIHEPLGLKKSNFKLRSLLIAGILLLTALILPVSFLLQPIYLKIDNPYFIIGFITLVFFVFLILENYNKRQLTKLVESWNKDLFIFNLSPFELIYLKNRKIDDVIHANVNNLFKDKIIGISQDQKLYTCANGDFKNTMKFVVYDTLFSIEKAPYTLLFKYLYKKPIFTNIQNAIDAFFKYVIKSKYFSRLFILNFSVISIVFLFGAGRLITGISRGKSVGLLTFILIIYGVISLIFLFRITIVLGKEIIPDFYKKNIIPTKENRHKWDWSAYLIGNSVLATAFIPLVYQVETPSSSNYSNANSCSSGNSCGSSCGSSCGGCGGD